jgi:hypothetical protein
MVQVVKNHADAAVKNHLTLKPLVRKVVLCSMVSLAITLKVGSSSTARIIIFISHSVQISWTDFVQPNMKPMNSTNYDQSTNGLEIQ